MLHHVVWSICMLHHPVWAICMSHHAMQLTRLSYRAIHTTWLSCRVIDYTKPSYWILHATWSSCRVHHLLMLGSRATRHHQQCRFVFNIFCEVDRLFLSTFRSTIFGKMSGLTTTETLSWVKDLCIMTILATLEALNIWVAWWPPLHGPRPLMCQFCWPDCSFSSCPRLLPPGLLLISPRYRPLS